MSSPKLTENWAGNIRFSCSETAAPSSISELQEIVASANRVRCVGKGHSFSAIAVTPGHLVTLAELPVVVEVDKVAMTASVSAHATYTQISDELHRHGLALSNLASLPHISVAGSVATATHGSGSRVRCLASAVVGLDLLAPSGEMVTLRRGSTPDFEGWVVAFGALGVVIRLTLEVEPAFQMTQHVQVGCGLDDVAADLGSMFASAYSVSLFTNWRGDGDSFAYLKRRVDEDYPEWPIGAYATEVVPTAPDGPVDSCSRQLGVVGWSHELLPHVRADMAFGWGSELQSEYFVPRDYAAAVFRDLQRIGERLRPVLQQSEVRSVRADSLWLSPAFERDSVTVHFTWINDVRAVNPVIRLLESVLQPYEARPHWAKLTEISPATIHDMYPKAGEFAQLVRDFDPTAKFENTHSHELLRGL